MEKKNTVLLTVIAVATLLVAVVGATFAYFTAQTTANGSSNETSVTTRSEVGGVTLTLANQTATGSDITYPGGYVVNGGVVTATSTGTDNYTVNYTLNGTITNATDTALSYKVVRLAAPLASEAQGANTGSAAVYGCTMRSYAAGTDTRYTYLVDGVNTQTTWTANQTSCKLHGSLASAVYAASPAADTVIASGTVAAKTGASATTETFSIASSATNGMILTSTSAGAPVYYYIVVEYLDASAQNAEGAAVTAQLTGVDNTSAVAATA